jgi:galactokinase
MGLAAFAELFGRGAEVMADAHGRVNLIGEHTDYNGGFVLPVPIPQRTTVELARREDRAVRVASALDGGAVHTFELGGEAPTGGWMDYVQGVTATLAQEGFRLRGFDARITSDVPAGSGLASSAALEVSLLRALRQALSLDLDDVRLALIGQHAENEFVGARVGVMDQMSASVGMTGHALFLDTRDLTWEQVALPETIDLIVIHSGISHANASSEYNVRRAECERACALLGIASLRDLRVSDLPPAGVLPPPLDRRTRHVVTENERVQGVVQALRAGAMARLGQLLTWSHESLRDDYEVSTPEIDRLVEAVARQRGVFGARLTGGGFGGSIVAVAERGAGSTAAEPAAIEYARQTGREPRLLLPT